MGKKLFKVGLVVNDIEKETTYFKNLFGMEETGRLGTPDGDYVWLKSGETIIELMPHKQMPDSPAGFHHLCFMTEDPTVAIEDLKAKGATILAEPFNAGFGITLADIEGPEGVLLRLFKKD